ncbi:ribonuclease inhibitor-like [Sinocyclocheilus grahami]|uniref:ribonuclease inhibitor-like n=1 Tax=Sinocyclocheilus grahami TaxID=75366 RepID=UPI0007ACFE10|nr:PREDICTED: ribonuclease inhibitor-like [Sinocyclocheilus grahami]
MESNHTLLQELVTQTGSCNYNKEETVEFIKQKIRENHSPERSINLFHCLNELGDDSLMQEIQDYLRSGQIGETKLSSSQWSALVYVLPTSEQKMDEFNLKQFIGAQNTADEVLQKLLPVIKESRSVQLSYCGVTDEGCAALTSGLRSNPSHLRELDLTGNEMGVSGLNLLSDGLKDLHCRLEKLKLSYCGVTDEGCAALTSGLRSNPSHLRELDLTGNEMGVSGLNLLSDGLKDLHCRLEKLKLRDCGVTDEGCAALASALRSNPSHLRELDLTDNKLGASDVKLLSDLLKDPRCKLKILSHNFQLTQRMLKLNLRKKSQSLHEGTATQGNPTLLNDIYTELYITESESGEINNEHEVRQIETQSRRAATEDTAIKCNDIFRPLPGQEH